MIAPETSISNRLLVLASALACAAVVCGTASAAPPDHNSSDSRAGGHPCTGDSCAASPAIRIVAVVLPFSGPHAAMGRVVADALSVSLGAVEGIRVVQFDTGGTAAGAERAAADAVRGGAAMIVGGIGDRESEALSSAAGKAGIPLVTMGRSKMPGATTIQAVASRLSMNLALVDELLKQGPLDCAWVIYMDSPLGGAELAAFRAALEIRGVVLAGSTRMHADGADEVEYAAAITSKMVARRESGACAAEVLHLVMDVDDAGRLVDHLRYSGYFDKTSGSVRLSGTGLFNAPGLVAQHGSSLKGLLFVDLDPVGGAARNGMFPFEVEDFASVAVGIASSMDGDAAAGRSPSMAGVAGRTGNLVLHDGVISGFRIRAWRLTGRGLEFVPGPTSSDVVQPAAP